MEVFLKNGEIATKNLTPGIKVYDEKLIQEDRDGVIGEYRIWNPRRSKLSAALLNGLEKINLENDAKVLYLGASTGTTVSHISDIVTEGVIYAVEFSPVDTTVISESLTSTYAFLSFLYILTSALALFSKITIPLDAFSSASL